MTPSYISLSFCSLSIVLQIMAYSVESRMITGLPQDDGWITVNKSRLCRVSQKYGICSRDFAIEDVVEEIGSFGSLNTVENLWKIKPGSKEASWEVCASALRQTVCEVAGEPLCSPDDENVKFVNITAAAREASCDNLWSSCGFVVDNVTRTIFTQYCAEDLWGKFANMSCKAVDGDFNGVCPQPIGKVPVFYTYVYQMNLLRLKAPFQILYIFLQQTDSMTFSCFTSVKELLCAPIYCSNNDANTVMMKTKMDCRRTISCIARGMEKSPKFKDVLDEVKGFIEDHCDLFDYSGIDAEPEVVAVPEVGAMEVKSCTCKTLSVQIPLMLLALCLKFLW